MTLDEAIKKAEEKVEEYKRCAEVHRQLIDVLKGLKTEREQEQDGWIPVWEKSPEPQEYGDKDYSEWLQITIHIGKDCDVVSKAFYCFSTGKWYTNDESAGNGKVSAWRPLLEPYRLRGNIDTIQARIDKYEAESE